MIIFFDIDHTLSDAFHRDGMIEDVMTDWDQYHAESIHDEPIPAMASLVRLLNETRNSFAPGTTLVGLTARPEKWRALTMRWLVQHEIPLTHLLMRADDDYRPAKELKLDLARGFVAPHALEDVPGVIVIDDREDVVMAFNTIGIVGLQAFTRR